MKRRCTQDDLRMLIIQLMKLWRTAKVALLQIKSFNSKAQIRKRAKHLKGALNGSQSNIRATTVSSMHLTIQMLVSDADSVISC